MFYCGNCILRPVLGYLPDLQEKRTGGIFPGRNSAVLHSYPDSSAFYVTDKKQPDVEAQAEAVLDRYGIYYDKSEVWIADERLYEVLYTMEVLSNE